MSLSLQPETFAYIAQFLKERSGLALTTDKLYLLETRLQPLATQHDFISVRALLEAFQRGKLPRTLQDAIVEAMTTNESLFLRDGKPFDALVTTMLPALAQSGVRDVRIWCAACSTGQEPFSVAMRVAEAKAQLLDVNITIDASDIAPKVIARAKEGNFTHFEVQRGLPIGYLLKYFTQVDKNRWQVKPAIHSAVRFFVQNLLAPMPASTQYHIVFCRYVLIYFDDATRASIIARLADHIPSGGYLVLGSSEAIRGDLLKAFEPLESVPGAYRRR